MRNDEKKLLRRVIRELVTEMGSKSAKDNDADSEDTVFGKIVPLKQGDRMTGDLPSNGGLTHIDAASDEHDGPLIELEPITLSRKEIKRVIRTKNIMLARMYLASHEYAVERIPNADIWAIMKEMIDTVDPNEPGSKTPIVM